jgi:hypothetical protein
MKNLRKVLALVLAIAMAFSVMAIASAKQIGDYSDASSVKYKEAVDLVTGLGIMGGAGGTTFDPTATFTREQAAKVICYVLVGKAVSDSLTTATSSFKDVDVTRWSAPFIEYCAAAGIINGSGDGNFNPTAPVTGSQMAKLLLTAIGYGAKGEFTGANWEIQALVKAQSLGILDIGINYSAAATREQVAKYVFNALTKAACGVVVYSPVTGTYGAAGATLGATTFGLAKVSLTANGVAAHKWTALVAGLTTVVSGIYNDDNVIATSTNGTTITDLTTYGNMYYKAPMDDTCTYFNNGAAVANRTAADAVADVSGCVVSLIDNDFDGFVDKVIMITKTVGFVTGPVTVSSIGTVTIPGVGTFLKDTVVYPADLGAYTTILKYQDSSVTPVTHIEKATAITGQLTGRSSIFGADSITFAGAPHSQTGLSGALATIGAFTTYNVDATIWVDDNGNVVNFLVSDTSATANYCVVLDSTLSGYTYVAKLLMTDGTVKVVTLGLVNGLPAAASPTADIFYTFAVGTDGSYNLTSTAAGVQTTAGAGATVAQVANFSTGYTGDSKTVFLYDSTATSAHGAVWTALTGVANAPKMSSTTNMQVISILGIAKYVYINTYTSGATPVAKVAFFVDSSIYSYTPTVGAIPAYKTYKAIVDNAEVQLKVADTLTSGTVANGLFTVTYDAYGFVDTVAALGAGVANTGTGTNPAANSTVKLDTLAYTYNDSTVVFYIDAYDNVVKGTISSVLLDANDTFTAYFTPSTLDAADLLSAIFIRSVA